MRYLPAIKFVRYLDFLFLIQSDGFDVRTLQTLDGPDTPSNDLSRSFEMKSLFNNKMMIDGETMSKLLEAEHGSSPALAPIPNERRFQAICPPSKCPSLKCPPPKCLPPLKLRRCTSMVEHSSRPLSSKFSPGNNLKIQ